MVESAATIGSITSRSCSASRRSARPVKPDRSANNAVISRRSSGAGTAAAAIPQYPQKRVPGMFSAPHEPQIQPAMRFDSTSLARLVEGLPVELEVGLLALCGFRGFRLRRFPLRLAFVLLLV